MESSIKRSLSFIEFIKEVTKNTQKGKIAILISIFRKYEGASRVAEKQAKRLAEQGYIVSIFTFETNIDLPNNINLEIIKPSIPIPQNLKWIYRALFFLDIPRINNCLKSLRDFDLIIVHHGNMAILGWIAKRIYGVKTIFWNHHLDPPHLSIPFKYKVYGFILGNLNWKLIRTFDYIVSVSEFSRLSLKKHLGIDSLVIYNEIDEKFRKGLDGKVIRKKLGLSNEPLLLFIGRLVPSKNVHLLIKAFKLIRGELKDAKLIIIGRRDDKNYYRTLKEMADESIFFMENVPEEELPFYYAACDVYVTCSEVEGFNLPLVEAQACGKPVVAFDIGPHREVVKKGYLVKPYDLIEFKEKVIEIIKRLKRYEA